MIAGTSTGGIIGIALALGHSASEILGLYEDRGAEIFGQDGDVLGNFLRGKLRGIRWLYRNKYDSDALKDALQDILGDRRIGHTQTRLVVPAWNPVARSVYIYKTAHHPRLRTDFRSLAVDAALATAAAPTYFRQHITRHDVGLLDGGIRANNPVAIAVVEAIGVLGWLRESLHVLSLGCLEETYTVPKWAGLEVCRASGGGSGSGSRTRQDRLLGSGPCRIRKDAWTFGEVPGDRPCRSTPEDSRGLAVPWCGAAWSGGSRRSVTGPSNLGLTR